MIALALILMSISNPDARESARLAPEGRPLKTTVGNCIIHGNYARCPVRAYYRKEHCRMVAHIHQEGGVDYTIKVSNLVCYAVR